jgi:hypothetical protein
VKARRRGTSWHSAKPRDRALGLIAGVMAIPSLPASIGDSESTQHDSESESLGNPSCEPGPGPRVGCDPDLESPHIIPPLSIPRGPGADH